MMMLDCRIISSEVFLERRGFSIEFDTMAHGLTQEQLVKFPFIIMLTN